MLRTFLTRSYRRLGARYLGRALFLQQQLVYPIIALAVAGLSLYVPMSFGQFIRLTLLGCLLQLAYTLLAHRIERRAIRPVIDWIKGDRGTEESKAAWRAAAQLPTDTLRAEMLRLPLGALLWVNFFAWSAYAVWELELPAHDVVPIYIAAMMLVCYAVALRFFGIERIARPVLEDIGSSLEGEIPRATRGPALRVRLLAALPAINVITSVVTFGLAHDGQATVTDLIVVLGISTAVAGTISLVLTLLVSSSIAGPIAELQEATGRIGDGDFEARVSVVATDEIGDLGQSFNEMAAGLAERERLHDAFGTFVDPELAEKVEEGTDLAGDDVEVSILFLDVRDFTAYAESASARNVVAKLNELFEQVVPIILEHGGNANKFVGDGLMAVFGAPERLDDHADHAVAAALEIAARMRERGDDDLLLGVGVHSGRVMSGTVGGGGRLDFTVIGDTVNTAARVEAATRETDDLVLITDATHDLLSSDETSWEPRPPIELKGKSDEVRLYAPAKDSDSPERERVGDSRDRASS